MSMLVLPTVSDVQVGAPWGLDGSTRTRAVPTCRKFDPGSSAQKSAGPDLSRFLLRRPHWTRSGLYLLKLEANGAGPGVNSLFNLSTCPELTFTPVRSGMYLCGSRPKIQGQVKLGSVANCAVLCTAHWMQQSSGLSITQRSSKQQVSDKAHLTHATFTMRPKIFGCWCMGTIS